MYLDAKAENIFIAKFSTQGKLSNNGSCKILLI